MNFHKYAWISFAICVLALIFLPQVFADSNKPIINCGTLTGNGSVRFVFPDKTFVIHIDCPAPVKGDV
jgi:hypothetical protein